ncbi:xanthine dehydrogenase family protein molybdopterin-binding subunit [Hufsiella ginkgonis]|uniref:Molybdopterin-dependent oxidoreductase n=1 Tax=Hufsiella ginkgonis TaxID=2695274 RepID=A0A7K1XTC3_9SPHI|nr:molybdopterin cofactor-binding domain-containing protein [Hufsiella ginkgonis]MXV14261.1 molybdopterin-dependent oxidoreductase [Hufsiella ginkgonis]
MNTGRRNFLKSIGSLTILFSLDHTHTLASLLPADPELPGILQRVPAINAWLEVLASGSVRVFTGKIEMGQGLCTAVAQVAAEELDMEMRQVEVIISETNVTPNEGYTGGGSSTETSVLAVRYAAAAARKELMDLAAQALAVPAEALLMNNGRIAAKQGGRAVSFYELLNGKKLTGEVKLPLTVKRKEDYRLSGKSVKREDFRQMITGQSMYIQDLRFPGMVHARTVRPPGYQSMPGKMDEAALAKQIPGLLKMVVNGGFLGVICTDEYQAVKAQRYLEANTRWDVITPPRSTKALPEQLKELQAQTRTVKTPALPFPEDRVTLKASYSKPYIMHGSIGPSCAIALYHNNELEVWTHGQGAYPARDTLSRLLGIPAASIHVKCVRGAGCFGHNGAEDAAAEAALLAVAYPGKHVRLQWSRAEEHAWEPYGTAMCMELAAVLEPGGRISHFRSDVWSDAHSTHPGGNPELLISANYLARPFIRKPNPVGGGGYRNADAYYNIPNQTVTAHFFTGPLRVSNLRSLGTYANIFALESFMDELAAKAETDPFAFRLMHLEDARAKETLFRLQEKVSRLPKEKNTAIGIAFSRYKNNAAYSAVAAQVTLDPATGKATVKKMWCVADAGEIISPDNAVNQLEGGMIQAASWTLFEEVKFEGGMVTSRDWASYPIIRFSDVPEVEAEIIQRPGEKLCGIGEIVMGVSAGAIGNAVARVSGKRVRDLPIYGTR